MRLGPIADEMLGGLHADSRMKQRIEAAARQARCALWPDRTAGSR